MGSRWTTNQNRSALLICELASTSLHRFYNYILDFWQFLNTHLCWSELRNVMFAAQCHHVTAKRVLVHAYHADAALQLAVASPARSFAWLRYQSACRWPMLHVRTCLNNFSMGKLREAAFPCFGLPRFPDIEEILSGQIQSCSWAFSSLQHFILITLHSLFFVLDPIALSLALIS